MDEYMTVELTLDNDEVVECAISYSSSSSIFSSSGSPLASSV